MIDLVFDVNKPLIDVADIHDLSAGTLIATLSAPNAFRVTLETYHCQKTGKIQLAAFAYAKETAPVARTKSISSAEQANSNQLCTMLQNAMVHFLRTRAIALPQRQNPLTGEPAHYFSGSLVITSPIHIFCDAYRGDVHRWILGATGAKPQSAVVSHFDAGKMWGYRTASFTLIDNETGESIGRFFSEHGEAGIFQMDEVEAVNPFFRRWAAQHQDQAVILPYFDGRAYLMRTRSVWGVQSTTIIGAGNREFRSVLTSRAERSIAI